MSNAKPCIVCGRKLENALDLPKENNQPNGGLAFTTHGHYGSTSFDPMDGTWLEINICDPCIVAAQQAGKVLLGERETDEQITDNNYKNWEEGA